MQFNLIEWGKENVRVLAYSAILLLLLYVGHNYLFVKQQDDSISLLTLELVAVTIFYTYETNKLTQNAISDFNLRYTPYLTIDLTFSGALRITEDEKERLVLSPELKLKNIGLVPIRYELIENEVEVVIGKEKLKQNKFDNLGTDIGPDSEAVFDLGMVSVSVDDLKKNHRIKVAFRYWSLFDRKQLYLKRRVFDLAYIGEDEKGNPLFRNHINLDETIRMTSS